MNRTYSYERYLHFKSLSEPGQTAFKSLRDELHDFIDDRDPDSEFRIAEREGSPDVLQELERIGRVAGPAAAMRKARYDAALAKRNRLKELVDAKAEENAYWRGLWWPIVELIRDQNLKADPNLRWRPETKLTPAEAIKKVAALRDQLTALISEEDRIESSRLPRAEAEARLDNLIERKAAEFNHSAHQLTHVEGSELNALTAMRLDPFGKIDPSFLFWLFGDVIRQRYCDELDLIYAKTAGVISTQERESRIQKIRAKTFAIEIEEENIIAATELAGHPIRRRPDARPEILLGVETVEPINRAVAAAE